MTKVAHVIHSVDVSLVGGPAYACKKLCLNLNSLNVRTKIFSFLTPSYKSNQSDLALEVDHLPMDPLAPYLSGWSPRGKEALFRDLIENPVEIIHNHGLWMVVNYYARVAALKLKIPLVISTRGMLLPRALHRKYLKKKIGWILYEKKNLSSATVIHATSSVEAEFIRKIGLKQPIAVIPNGVDLPVEKEGGEDEFDFKIKKDSKVLLFLSRIHPIKGLDRLFNVWEALSVDHPDWQLVIAGDGNEKFVCRLKLKAKAIGLNRIVWLGAIAGEKKEALWKRADLFILPTYSENFGNVIAEALAHRVPVVTTQGAPWAELAEFECGWWAENDEKGLKRALREALALSLPALKLMGNRGFNLVCSQYNWGDCARKMADTYSWILNKKDKPDFVWIN